MSGAVLIVILISSLAYILGGALVLFKKNWSSQGLSSLTALSAGLLLSIAILDLIPDTSAELANNSVFIMLGFLIMYGIHIWSKMKASESDANGTDYHEKEAFTGLSAGMLVHNFFEGLAIGMSYAVNFHFGVLVSVALIVHKIPEGLSYTSAMLASLRNRGKTAVFLLIQGAFIWLGAGSAVFLWDVRNIGEQGVAVILSMIAGIFLYLGGTSLLPVANAKPFPSVPYFFLGGVVFYFIFHDLATALG
ncbi:MAG TPA: ZIP family metal transporter [Bacillales bacterium]|nr:ZIP family metal transporter [Bacillales bacterium]